MGGFTPAGVYEFTVMRKKSTTAAGNAGGTTIIDTGLIGLNDFLTDATLLIMSGACKLERRGITGFSTITGTVTVSPAFSAQIASGVTYAVLSGISDTADITALMADVGDASASALNSLYGILGNPAQSFLTMIGYQGATSLADKITAARAALIDQITALRMAELDAANLPADIDTIKADTQVIEDSTLKVTPTAGSLASFIATGGTALGTPLPASKSLYDCLSGGVTVVDRVAGKRQVFVKAITVAANAGATTIGTITNQPCVIESTIIHANTAQTADLTSCAVTGGASNIITFINAAIAIQANLDAIDKQVAWIGSVRLGATKTIVITPVGIAATALDLTIIITYYSSAVSGGYIV